MPVKRRILKTRKGYSEGHLLHYYFGHDWFGGFGRVVTPEIEAEMRASWPLLREKVFAYARERSIRRGTNKLPAFWWIYDAPQARNKNITEAVQLERMGLDASVLLFG